ncbi:MAG TPA: 30S ribosomal protein S1, partial [Balneolaceae bacterium]|nr:30S ribosomal protein S1 [Balneolaceae bacterium]
FVKLPLGAEAFLNYSKSTEAEYKEGDKVEDAFVLNFDENSKNIEISQLDSDKDKAKKAKKKVDTSNMETGAPTLGEMSGLAALKADMEEKEKAEAQEKADAAKAKKKAAEDTKAEKKEEDESSDEEE